MSLLRSNISLDIKRDKITNPKAFCCIYPVRKGLHLRDLELIFINGKFLDWQ